MESAVDRFAHTPVLLYHEVLPEGRSSHPYTVTADAFERQLAHMAEAGYRTPPPEECWSGGAGAAGRGGHKNVVITFDDAQMSNYTHALPLLLKYGFRAVFFIPTAFIGADSGQVSAGHLAEMEASGMSIHSHSHTHRFLSALAEDDVVEELQRSRAILEECLKRPVEAVACPGGRYSRAVLSAARKAGYRAIFTSRPGFNESPQRAGLYVFDRLLIEKKTSHAEFAGMLELRRELIKRKILAYQTKVTAKAVLGEGLYHYIWRKVLGS